MKGLHTGKLARVCCFTSLMWHLKLANYTLASILPEDLFLE